MNKKKNTISPEGDTFSLTTNKHHNYYAVMIFNTPQELSLDNNDTISLNTSNHFYRNGKQALQAFLYDANQNKRLATGETPEELKKDMIKIYKKYGIHSN